MSYTFSTLQQHPKQVNMSNDSPKDHASPWLPAILFERFLQQKIASEQYLQTKGYDEHHQSTQDGLNRFIDAYGPLPDNNNNQILLGHFQANETANLLPRRFAVYLLNNNILIKFLHWSPSELETTDLTNADLVAWQQSLTNDNESK